MQLKNVHWMWVSAAIIIVDQLTKQWVVRSLDWLEVVPVTPFFNLTLLRNTGAAFSLFSSAPGAMFIVLGLVVALGIMIWLRRNPTGQRLLVIGLVCLQGGAVGNVIDRATRGYVVDFLDFHLFDWHWPAFNVADIAICIGAALLLVDMWLEPRRESRSD